jgi:hypothetical protein
MIKKETFLAAIFIIIGIGIGIGVTFFVQRNLFKPILLSYDDASVEDDDADMDPGNEEETATKFKKKILGRLEILDFPELELFGINVKIDTGANTSSIHCHDIQKIERDGKQYVSFELLDPKHPYYMKKRHEFPIYKERDVKSSSGDIEHRITIITKILIYKKIESIELALTDRSYMKIPVLLGRNFLKGKYMVDVSRMKQSYKSITKK